MNKYYEYECFFLWAAVSKLRLIGVPIYPNYFRLSDTLDSGWAIHLGYVWISPNKKVDPINT